MRCIGWHMRCCFIYIQFLLLNQFFFFLMCLQDRLLYLDIAEDFLAKAKRFYPPKEDSDEEIPGLAINLPLLLARVEAMNGRGQKDDSESEKEDENFD